MSGIIQALFAVRGQASPTYVGGASATNAAGVDYSITLNSLSGGVGSAPQSGDLIVVVTGISTTGIAQRDVGVTTAGYTQAFTDLFSNDPYEATMVVAYKVSDGTETSVTVLGSGSSNRGAASVAHVWRNVNTTTPMDVTPTTATGLDSLIPNSPAITPTTAGSVILACGLGSSAASNTTALTTPSGMENAININASGSNTSCKTSIASYSAWASGAYNPPAWTGGGTDSVDYAWCAATISLRPA
jgi:hypothetical protein